MAIMTRSGRAALADAIRQRPLHLAWGTGNIEWGSTCINLKPWDSSSSRSPLILSPLLLRLGLR